MAKFYSLTPSIKLYIKGSFEITCLLSRDKSILKTKYKIKEETLKLFVELLIFI